MTAPEKPQLCETRVLVAIKFWVEPADKCSCKTGVNRAAVVGH